MSISNNRNYVDEVLVDKKKKKKNEASMTREFLPLPADL